MDYFSVRLRKHVGLRYIQAYVELGLGYFTTHAPVHVGKVTLECGGVNGTLTHLHGHSGVVMHVVDAHLVIEAIAADHSIGLGTGVVPASCGQVVTLLVGGVIGEKLTFRRNIVFTLFLHDDYTGLRTAS